MEASAFSISDGMHVLETSWEVANKVGGIHTVIKTKSASSVHDIGHDKYFMLGPLLSSNHHQVQTEVEEYDVDFELMKLESEQQESSEKSKTFTSMFRSVKSMRDRGCRVIIGKWLIESEPNVILFDVEKALSQYEYEWLNDFHKLTNIETPSWDSEAKNAVIFGYLVQWFTGEFLYQYRHLPVNVKSTYPMVVSHFHEWQVGPGLILCRLKKLSLATVFTTHATLLGRHLCASSTDFYNSLERIDCDKESGIRNIYAQYLVGLVFCFSLHKKK